MTVDVQALVDAGVEDWNAWRAEHPDVTLDVSGLTFDYLDLSGINFSGLNFSGHR